MNLKITRPICFFDVESTGTNIIEDRIIEISLLKIHPDNKKEIKTWLIHPGIPIPSQSTAIHGITNNDVINKPTFKMISKNIFNIIKNSDLAGYNSNRFDIPILAEELLRAGLFFNIKNHKTIDVQTIFHKMEPRTLKAAYQYYCQKDLHDAHSAQSDTIATYEILEAQLKKYHILKNDVVSLNNFCIYKRSADIIGYILLNDEGEEIFNFGKYKGRKVLDVFKTDPNYYYWIQNSKFPLYTKKILTDIKLKNI
jgi:DNA polymerase-3 subunit epsilon